MSMSDMAERMMVNLKTVQRMEKGDPCRWERNRSYGTLGACLHRRLGDLGGA